MASGLSDMSPSGARSGEAPACRGEETKGIGCSTPLKEKQLAKGRGDNAVTQQLVKTKMCTFFERGKCASTTCRYAHSADELRLAPNLHKTKLCKLFMQGGCSDENCPFAHGEQDMRVTEGIYKTQMCNFFERGYCKKGDRCNHAHGVADLRASTTPSKSQARDAARTPVSAARPGPGSDSSTPLQHRGGAAGYPQPRRSPLPLAQLLTGDSEAPASLPTPSKVPTPSVTELASLAFSPAPAPPMWQHLPGMPLVPGSPLGARPPAGLGCLPPLGIPRALWPVLDSRLDPVSMLVAPEQLQAQPGAPQAAWAAAASPVIEPEARTPPPASRQPLRVELAEPFTSTPPSGPGLRTQPLRANSPEAVEDLSERLAKLDCLVKGFSADIAELTGRHSRSDSAHQSSDRQRHIAL